MKKLLLLFIILMSINLSYGQNRNSNDFVFYTKAGVFYDYNKLPVFDVGFINQNLIFNVGYGRTELFNSKVDNVQLQFSTLNCSVGFIYKNFIISGGLEILSKAKKQIESNYDPIIYYGDAMPLIEIGYLSEISRRFVAIGNISYSGNLGPCVKLGFGYKINPSY